MAQDIGVPIEWVITSGYGASKRFEHGSADAMKLMDPPDSFIHMAANADIDNRLKERGIDSIYKKENVVVGGNTKFNRVARLIKQLSMGTRRRTCA